MKTKISTALLFFIASHIVGQVTPGFEQRLYSSYVKGEIMEWKEIIRDMKAGYRAGQQKELLYSLCFAQYGYIGYCIDRGLEKEAKDCLKDARIIADELETLYNGRHDVLALQGAFLGYQIILSKFSALYLGPKAYKLIHIASASSDTYFNCSLEIGNMRYFTPKFLGGSKEEAISYYKNAVEIIEKSSNKEERNWLYINTVLLLANAYYETDSKDLACELYERILNYEPAINWIRDEMLKKCKENG